MIFAPIQKLKEEVIIRPYSVQAIARKRNMMMNTLQLDDSQFMNWVRDRMYRVAEQNKLPIKELTMDYVSMGFKEWEKTLRQGDKDFDQYQQQFMDYSQKFLKYASRVATDAISNPKTGKLSPSEDEVPPTSPNMVKFQAQS